MTTDFRAAKENSTFEERRAAAVTKRYASLREQHPDVYEKAIRYANGLAINLGLTLTHAAEVESSMVCLAIEILHP